MGLAYSGDQSSAGRTVEATGLSADPEEYRTRLAEQSDEQIDTWAAELMRDVAKRRGVIRVLYGPSDGRPAERE